ncbi:hypothetical protein [Cyclobacterium marinum]|uniref:hypothetical protein n=1 Tax=Cyclobacterium marinum TaxID=104 RepID=UPI0012FA75DA|nr:hypothetical protein [Cyclobacterium marinum]
MPEFMGSNISTLGMVFGNSGVFKCDNPSSSKSRIWPAFRNDGFFIIDTTLGISPESSREIPVGKRGNNLGIGNSLGIKILFPIESSKLLVVCAIVKCEIKNKTIKVYFSTMIKN